MRMRVWLVVAGELIIVFVGLMITPKWTFHEIGEKAIIIYGMEWIFLSPHFDDAALSCGGIIAEEVRRGAKVGIWTVCAAPAPTSNLSAFAEQLHARWGGGAEAYNLRKEEDIASCSILGSAYRHLEMQDCIYRTGPNGEHLYPTEESLSGSLHTLDKHWIERLHEELADLFPAQARVVCPLGFGNHVDHQLTRAAAEKLGLKLWYYADYPYVQRKPTQLEELREMGWKPRHFRVSTKSLATWQASIAAHASQISTFWSDVNAMGEAIRAYHGLENATNLWQKGEIK